MTDHDLTAWERMRTNPPVPESSVSAVMLRDRLSARQSWPHALRAARERVERERAADNVARIPGVAADEWRSDADRVGAAE